jgi:hypothetical protein
MFTAFHNARISGSVAHGINVESRLDRDRVKRSVPRCMLQNQTIL